MAINNGDMPASPVPEVLDLNESEDCRTGGGRFIPQNGLTKREQFAMAAMQGILSNQYYADFCNDGNHVYKKNAAAKSAIKHADALLAELENQND